MDLSQREIALAGLGGMKSVGVDPRVTELQNMLLAKEGTTVARRQAIEQIHNLPEATIEGLLNGSIELVNKTYYSRVELNGTAPKLIKNEAEQAGVTNLDKGEVENPCVLHALQLDYSATAVAVFAPAAIPAEIARGEFTLIYNKSELMNISISGTFATLNNYDTQKPYGKYNLDNPKVLVPDVKIEANLNYPTDFAAGTHSVGIIFHVTEFVSKSARKQ